VTVRRSSISSRRKLARIRHTVWATGYFSLRQFRDARGLTRTRLSAALSRSTREAVTGATKPVISTAPYPPACRPLTSVSIRKTAEILEGCSIVHPLPVAAIDTGLMMRVPADLDDEAGDGETGARPDRGGPRLRQGHRLPLRREPGRLEGQACACAPVRLNPQAAYGLSLAAAESGPPIERDVHPRGSVIRAVGSIR
jgi:hypothetical protein